MSQAPPPPPAAGPPAPAGARPSLVTAAAVCLYVVGGLTLLGALLLLTLSGVSSMFTIIGILYIGLGGAAIYAGVQVMAGREQGRMLGLVIAGIGALLSILAVTQTPVAILNLVLYGFIIYALVTTAAWFKR
jgi:hypothetical protein